MGRNSVRRLRLLPLISCLLLVFLPTWGSAAHAKQADQYVALGDSFTSGVGTREYAYDDSGCYRSNHAYPVLARDRLGLELSFQACSGAEVPDVQNRQLGTLNGGTDLVTLMVGGNDAGYGEVLTECAPPWWASDCDGAVNDAQAFIRNSLGPLLAGLYGTVRSKAPNAETTIVGYPRLFMGEDCNAGTWFSPREMQRINNTGDMLNAKINEVATAHGFKFVNPTDAFRGHAVCDDVEWINGLSNPVRESYHPNRAGQSGYYALVDDHLQLAHVF